MRFLFTGTSGLDIRQGLQKLAAYTAERRGDPAARAPVVLCLEDFIARRGEPAVRQLNPTHVRPDEFVGTATLPKPLLRQLWKDGHSDLVIAADQADAEGRDVFIHLHATWFHRQNEEFFTEVSPADLCVHNAPRFLTIVDDIYDVRARLLKNPRLLTDDLTSRSPARDFVLQSIRDLRFLLRWREIETLVSDSIAHVVAPNNHFLVAAKHPLSSFFSLLFDHNKFVVYFSHPISEPRRLLASGSDTTVDEGRRSVDNIQAVAAHLRNRVTLFEPTSIDELRIAQDAVGTRRPLLNERWPLPSPDDDLLFWNRPKGMNDTHAFDLHRAPADGSEADAGVSDALRELASAIQEQVNSRDHKLVEQSFGLAIWRPLYRGNPSRGVREELIYLSNLVRTHDPRKDAKAFIYCPSDDVEAYFNWELFALVEAWLRRGIIRMPSPAAEARLKRDARDGTLRAELLSASRPRRALALEAEVERRGGTIHVPPEVEEQGRSALGGRFIRDEWLGDQADSTVGEHLQRRPYLEEEVAKLPNNLVLWREPLEAVSFAEKVFTSH